MTTRWSVKEIEAYLKNTDPAQIPEAAEAFRADERKGAQAAVARFEQRKKAEEAKAADFLEKQAFDQQMAPEAAFIAGIDEVGRGPLAGPVMAAAVILPSEKIFAGITDSKKLSEAKRREYLKEIEACADVGIGEASAEEIDQYNIYQATRLAMKRAVSHLERSPGHLIVDAMHVPVQLPQTSIVQGDEKSAAVAAASIAAKVTRDEKMAQLSREYPGYGFESNSGYGTKAHLEALETYGVTPVHRRSFAPVRNLVQPGDVQ
ncbi:RNase HII [Salsuginibacillus halophilus]|uniref:Ribonuclease HII n=1 Tax=Salsuginibacillus halophilus TaxID=517424 RepID=A0A2P8HY57_9BACI|nr:ribonuclease HII [Salsuginibacillus halophilus]PSL51172.1 RNase HII [Salsuginibacillus halophilus]